MGDLVDFIGVPYVSHGRQPDGLDCWGLILLAAKQLFGVDVPDYCAYEDSNSVDQIKPLFEGRNDWQRIQLADVQPCDVIVFNMMGNPIHAGICVGDGRMLHTLTGRDSCIERFTSSSWSRRIEGVYRWQKH